MNKDILIGGAWPYANYFMHIGHLAALLPGDILAKYFRANGDNVMYVSGTDSHGTPITQRAAKDGVSPAEIAKKYHEAFVKSFTAYLCYLCSLEGYGFQGGTSIKCVFAYT